MIRSLSGLVQRRSHQWLTHPFRGWMAGFVALSLLGVNAAPSITLPPLTTLSDSPRLPGKFVWADLVTDDALAVRKFYSGLFGWKYMEMGGYSVAVKDDVPIAGIFQRPRPADGRGEPRWFGYVSVSNLEDAQRTVLRAGGRVLAPPRKLPQRGQQAVFADPEGALFGVIKSTAGDPPDALAEPGEWIWIQLLSHDSSKAAKFYRELAGYSIVENSLTNRISDYVLTSKGYARATVSTIPTRDSKVKPTWLLFLRVSNVSETLAQVKPLGGTVLIEPRPNVFEGKVAVIADPTGAAVGILEWSEELMKGGH